jgi:hypothetical protein
MNVARVPIRHEAIPAIDAGLVAGIGDEFGCVARAGSDPLEVLVDTDRRLSVPSDSVDGNYSGRVVQEHARRMDDHEKHAWASRIDEQVLHVTHFVAGLVYHDVSRMSSAGYVSRRSASESLSSGAGERSVMG